MKKYIILLFIAIVCLVAAYLYRTGRFPKAENNVVLAEPTSKNDIYRSVVWPLLDVEIRDTGMIHFLNNQMKEKPCDTLLVFRYNKPDCMACMEFIYTLSMTCQKNFNNVVILSNIDNPRALKLFEMEMNNAMPVYNNKTIGLLPFEKISNTYVFLYTRNSHMASCFFIPEKQNEPYNEKMILSMLGKDKD